MNMLALYLLQDFDVETGVAGAMLGMLGAFMFVYFAIIILMIACMWMVFAKAGQPGWAVIIPIYNVIVLLKMVRKPWWWLFLMIIPIANIVVAILVLVELAKSFGKGTGFALGLLFLPFVFYPILAFGNAQYR